ncbi:hypothetical protein [Luteimonas deserti]|uniref:DUF1311 domain-containing protein n=1 Tax=Luteimonas deserti TaxID=2752306 RepID=A0A7Z0TVH3_9GAMM|nr:hypothetical protein [Luteimonas deserti]NYZ62254.1 hypothetical protein [Luteimonas deserti]
MFRHVNHLASAIALTLGVTACAPAAPPADGPAPPVQTLPAFDLPAPATEEQRMLGGRQVEELDRMLALDTRCGWLDPAARAALTATAAERRAWLVWQGGEPAAVQAGEPACDNAQLRTGLQYGAWQMRVTWTLRAHAMLDGTDRPAWLSGLSTVGTQRDALQEASDGLDARYGASIQQARPGIEQEAQRMLAARCKLRAQADACPALPNDQAFSTYADRWLEQAEAYAAVLGTVDDKVGMPPADD